MEGPIRRQHHSASNGNWYFHEFLATKACRSRFYPAIHGAATRLPDM